MASDAKRRARTTGRGKEHSYLGIPHYILRSPEFGSLSGWETKLLIQVASNYNGKNNGDLSAAFSVLSAQGWHSAGTLSGTIKALVKARWLIRTRHGGRNRCALFAVSWWPIDYCEGKWLEIRAETTPRHSWKTESVVAMRTNVVAMRTSQDQESAA